MTMLLISIVTFSQVIDRPTDGVNSIISVNGTDGNQVFIGDTFTLTADTDLGELDIFGTNSNAVLAPNLSGFSVYIYADAASLPSGDPTMAATGVVEMPLVDMTNITVLADDAPGAGSSDYTLDLVTANGGTVITLPAGDYWLVVSAVTNDSLGLGRWNWSTSAVVATVEPVLIDPADLFGVGATSWTNVSGLIGATMSSAAWQLREPAGPVSSTDACGTYTNSPGAAFIDNDAITDIITVPVGAGVIDDLNIAFDISHTWIADLEISLTSPAGTTVDLLFDPCGNNDDMNIMLDDEGVAIVCADPTIGDVIPDNPLSAFDGEDFEGDWTVSIADDAAGDTGMLNTWCLIPTFVVTCGDPTALSAIVTDTTADLGWTVGPDAETMWDVEWGAVGFAPGTGAEAGMVVGTMDNPYTATGLTAETDYEFYVRAGCTAVDYSGWAGPFAFTTEVTLNTDLTCGDNYYDTGGQAGDYSDDESVTTVVLPSGATGEVVTVTFTYVDIETSGTDGGGVQDGCWDFLTVYDGPDTSAPLLAATLCGETDGDGGVSGTASSVLEPGMSFTSTHASGALTFVFTSDGSVSETGWEADVTCGFVSVADNVIDGFDFYPNPAKNTINLTALNTIDNVEVFNMVGQKVISQNLNTTTGQLDISKLSAGMYVMKVTSNDQVGSYQIVKK